MRVPTVASAIGMLTGIWVVGGSIADGISKGTCSGICPAGFAVGPSFFVIALSVLLFLNSVVTLVGPRITFYASAVLSVLLGASMIPSSSFTNPVVLVAFGLLALTVALSLVAGRRRAQISEQYNPMNLPVFG